MPSETAQSERLLSPEEVAQVCGLSRRAVYRAISRGELAASRLCNRLRIQPAELERWIGAGEVSPPRRLTAPPPRVDKTLPRGSLRAKLHEAGAGSEVER